MIDKLYTPRMITAGIVTGLAFSAFQGCSATEQFGLPDTEEFDQAVSGHYDPAFIEAADGCIQGNVKSAQPEDVKSSLEANLKDHDFIPEMSSEIVTKAANDVSAILEAYADYTSLQSDDSNVRFTYKVCFTSNDLQSSYPEDYFITTK